MASAHRILVTGADGFIGSHLVEMLCKEGYDVRALAQYNSFSNWGWLEDVNCKNEIDLVSGDIRDPFFCEQISNGVDAIFHLAALILCFRISSLCSQFHFYYLEVYFPVVVSFRVPSTSKLPMSMPQIYD